MSPGVAAALSCTEARHDDRVEVAIVGELNFATAGSLVAMVERGLATRTAHLVPDLGGVPFSNSSGLAALVKIRRMCDDSGCELRLCRLGGSVVGVLSRTGLYAYLNVTQAVDGP